MALHLPGPVTLPAGHFSGMRMIGQPVSNSEMVRRKHKGLHLPLLHRSLRQRPAKLTLTTGN